MRNQNRPKYISFSVLDDLEATDNNAARDLANRSENDDQKLVSGVSKIIDDYEIFQVVIPLSDTIGLKTAQEYCERICYILNLNDEVLKYTEPTFYSKYPHMKKLGVPRMESSRTSNVISFFIAFRRESIRLLDKLFLRLSRLCVDSTSYITVIDSEGDTGMYDDSYVELMQPRKDIYNIAYLLGFNTDEIDVYVNRK